MQLGMVGLGRMGANMAERLRDGGHEVIGYDAFSDATEVASLGELVERLAPPRVVWVMVPAGDATAAVVGELTELLEAGDLVIEGGNSLWTDAHPQAEGLRAKGVSFVDAGVSGGVWGIEAGYALMVGGEDADVERVWPIFETLAPDDPTGTGLGLAHVGGIGTGHFAKMVHNGVEYAMMQAYAEGYELLTRHPVGVDVPAALRSWQTGSVVRSWLLDLLVRALDQRPGFADIDDVAADSGEGRWTVQAAVEARVPVPAIAASLFARFESQTEHSLAMKAVAAMREQFGGHAVVPAAGEDD